MPAPADNTTRFTDRVDDYVRYRPGYPDVLFATLRDVAGLSAHAIIADVGSGTGISTSHLLRAGWDVFAVEPNAAMRAAAERAQGGNPHFHSVEGRAERTTLAPASVDAVTAAQAFHWFDLDEARAEFVRILKPPQWAALIAIADQGRAMKGGAARDDCEPAGRALLQAAGGAALEIGWAAS